MDNNENSIDNLLNDIIDIIKGSEIENGVDRESLPKNKNYPGEKFKYGLTEPFDVLKDKIITDTVWLFIALSNNDDKDMIDRIDKHSNISKEDFVEIFYKILSRKDEADETIKKKVYVDENKRQAFIYNYETFIGNKNRTSNSPQSPTNTNSHREGTIPTQNPQSTNKGGSSSISNTNPKNLENPIFGNENAVVKESEFAEKTAFFNNEITEIKKLISDITGKLDEIRSEQAALSEQISTDNTKIVYDLNRIKNTVLKTKEVVDNLSVPQENETILPEDSETIRKIRELTIQMVDCLAFAAQNSNNPTNNETSEEIK